jgi:hypothetical protein
MLPIFLVTWKLINLPSDFLETTGDALRYRGKSSKSFRQT